MVGLAFFFEDNDADVYSGRVVDLDAWHLASLLSGDVTSLLVVNKTNIVLETPNANLDFMVVKELPDLPEAAYLDPVRGASLWEVDHSKINWYVIGPSTGWDNTYRDYINIPQSGQGHCHSQHIATTVMFSRYGALNGSYISGGNSKFL